MTSLIESPYPVLFVGVVAVAVLAIAFFNTRRGVFLIAMAGAVLLTLLGLGVEHFVVTPREEVEAELDSLADAMEANDAQAVLGHLSPAVVAQTRSRAEDALQRYKILEARISGLEIEVNKLTSPPSAKACFKGFIKVNDKKGELPYGQALFDFTIDYRKQGDRWLITGHTEKFAELGKNPN